MLNGTFGKTGSPYSVLFAPEMMIQTTITGQLALLMLIEHLETASISVISANTDGIVIQPQVSQVPFVEVHQVLGETDRPRDGDRRVPSHLQPRY